MSCGGDFRKKLSTLQEIYLHIGGKSYKYVSTIRHIFPDNFLRAEINPEDIDGSDMDQAILQSLNSTKKSTPR